MLARMATTGIYLVRGVPRELQPGASAVVREGTTLRSVFLKALAEYSVGNSRPIAGPHDHGIARPRNRGRQFAAAASVLSEPSRAQSASKASPTNSLD